MDGLNEHLKFQIKLAGGKLGAESGSGESESGMSYSTLRSDKTAGFIGETPDDIPDIGMMVPIERVD